MESNAHIEFEEVDVIVKKKQPVKVILELSIAEAQALFDVCQNVGGHPRTSRRRYIDNVNRVFSNILTPTHYDSDKYDIDRKKSSLYFNYDPALEIEKKK